MGSRNIDPDYIPGTDYIFTNDIEFGDDVVRDGDIVVVPQPTISPNDPLTWSRSRKVTQLMLVLLFTGLTAATSNAIASASDGMRKQYPNISVENANTGAGVLFLGIAWWTWLGSPSVYLYGSRLGYLIGILLSIGGNLWYANVQTVGDVIWSQLFIGASESVTEAVAQLSITQVFYQHQATHFIGLYVLAISVGTFVGPLVGGIVADNINWHWVGYVGAICSGFVGLLLLFFLEETYFDRSHFSTINVPGIEAPNAHEGTDENEEEAKTRSEAEECTASRIQLSGFCRTEVHAEDTSRNIPEKEVEESKEVIADEPKTYWQRIQFITPARNLRGLGFKQYVKRLILMLRVLLFPPVIFAGLQWGAQDAWLSFYVDLEAIYYYEPPWNYSDAAVGIMNIPCLIGATLGCIYGGWFSEWFVLYMAKRNGGLREAESRLWCLLPAGIISPVGMILLGIGTERYWSWPAPYVGLGMIGFGWGCCGDLSMSYLVDCYPEMVLEGMVGVSLINNNIACIFSFVVDLWMSAIGPQNSMISIAVLNFFFVFLSLPMIIWGKSCRKWTRGMYFRFVEKRDSLNCTS